MTARPLSPDAPGEEPAARLAQADLAQAEIGRCEDCRWWDSSTSLDRDPNTGACRKLPPVADDRSGKARWPYTEDTDWCAGFQPGNHGMAP